MRDEPPAGDSSRSAPPSPGRYTLGTALADFDSVVDRALQPLRGRPVPDAIFRAASTLGDWSLIWHLVGITRVVVEGRRGLRRSLVFAGLLGAESLIVNQGLKRIFNRQRPTVAGAPGLEVRRPLTSSFPSGHASAAGFATVILTDQEGPRSALLWAPAAATVATSRVYVRIHHASDVIAGVAAGAALGLAGRAVSRRLLGSQVLR